MCRSFVIVAVFLESSLAGSPVKTSDETQKACGLFSFAKRFGLRMGHVSKRAQIWWSGRGQRCETCIKVQEYKPVNMYKPYCQLFPSIAWDSFHSFSTYRLQLVTSCLVCATGYILEGSLHKASACYLFARPGKGESLQFALPRCVLWGPGLPSLCSASCNGNIVWRVRTATPWDMTQQQVKAFWVWSRLSRLT